MTITPNEGPKPGYIPVNFILRKTTLELERMIFTTLYFAGAENTDMLNCISDGVI
jgi:hypothetical protein